MGTQCRGGASVWKGQGMMWSDTNGSSTGDSHGRRNPISVAAAGQWQVGDIIATGSNCPQETTTTTTTRPGSYFMMPKGSCCCSDQDRISTKAECEKVHDALGLHRHTVWTGATGSIPG